MRKQPSINEIEKLTEEYTWMGGNPNGLKKLFEEFEFTEAAIQIAIKNVKDSSTCGSTYNNELMCVAILNREIDKLNSNHKDLWN